MVVTPTTSTHRIPVSGAATAVPPGMPRLSPVGPPSGAAGGLGPGPTLKPAYVSATKRASPVVGSLSESTSAVGRMAQEYWKKEQDREQRERKREFNRDAIDQNPSSKPFSMSTRPS
ncbi:unnamed protein product [Amoebophrya sp. A120]|nr:unnamed protein product [Amoebophrya sp. A120]|eukprot:GSA120T00016691001.1